MGIRTVREYGRFVARAVGGDASVLMDATLDPAEFPLAGSAKERPEEYDLWRVTLEEVTGRKGTPTGYSLNLRKWTRRRPTDKNPSGYEGPVRDDFHGGVNLSLPVAAALANAFSTGATDGVAYEAANQPVDREASLLAQLAALQAENAALKEAASE